MNQLCAKSKPSRLVKTALGNGITEKNELLIRKLRYYELLLFSLHGAQRMGTKLTVDAVAKISFTDVMKGGMLRT